MNLSVRRRAAGMTPWLALLLLGFLAPHAEAKHPKERDLADTVIANPITKRFAVLMQASDMVTFLSSRGPFVLFAPTDSAFSRMPPETFEALLRPENKVRLQNIILYHVVYGKVLFMKDLVLQKSLVSCQGAPLPLRTSKSGAQFILKAKVVHGDIPCANGIIDEIDNVLMPPEASMPALVPLPPPPVAAPVEINAAPETGTNQAPAATTIAPPAVTNAPPVNAPPAVTNAPPVNAITPAPAPAPEMSPH
jgi:uncharacterized surface protein with fasciclin (FAS1) repeats